MNTETKKFDLTQHILEETATMVVQNAKGDDDFIGADGTNPITIEYYGPGTKQAVRAQHKAGQAAQLRVQGMMRGKIDKTSGEKAEEEQADKLIALTKCINNAGEITAEAIYSNPGLCYITQQAIKFNDDNANFAKGSAKS